MCLPACLPRVSCVCVCTLANPPQCEEHAATLKTIRLSHAEELAAALKAHEQEKAAKEALEKKLASSEAMAQKTISRLRSEVDALAQTNGVMERHLREAGKTFTDEQSALKSQWTAQVARLSQQAEDERKALGREVSRLRHVQEHVLDVGGRGALTGDARRLLFYESMKSKQLLQPDGSLSWRGQHDVPKAEKAAQTTVTSPPRSRSASPPRGNVHDGRDA